MVSEESQAQNTNAVRFHLPWVLKGSHTHRKNGGGQGLGEEGMGVTV